MIENIREYFLVDLPNSINNFFGFLGDAIGGLAWIIFIIVVAILAFLLIKSSKQQLATKNLIDKENDFLSDISGLKKAIDVENKIFEYAFRTLQCRYSALYELRGVTYVAIGSNTNVGADKQRVAISMRLKKSDLKSFNSSGNFEVIKVMSKDKNLLLLLFSNKNSVIGSSLGALQVSLGYYQALDNEVKISSDKTLAKVSEETMQAIFKAQFGKEGYLKFLVAIILKIFNAKGGIIASHDGNESYEVGNITVDMKKEFFIRNTPYKFRYYNDIDLSLDQIKEIGSFLDLSGSYLVSLDHQSSIMQNYVSFLKSANKIMENSMPYYENHSEQVKVVAVEIAQNLFMDQASLDNIELAAELHDIGMIGNMDLIMTDSELGKSDIDLMHYHPVIGAILLEPIAHLYPITTIVKQHHERFDGRGYPNKLESSDITIDAQTVALAEHFVGLISDRSYRKGMDFDAAVEEIKKGSDKMFDPIVVNSFIESKNSILKKITKIKNLTNQE